MHILCVMLCVMFIHWNLQSRIVLILQNVAMAVTASGRGGGAAAPSRRTAFHRLSSAATRRDRRAKIQNSAVNCPGLIYIHTIIYIYIYQYISIYPHAIVGPRCVPCANPNPSLELCQVGQVCGTCRGGLKRLAEELLCLELW